MSTRLFSVLVCCFLVTTAWAQELPWQNLKVPSKALALDQPVQVYVPDKYATSDQSYPVLYVLDGHWYFFNGVSIQKTLRGNREMPKMIVVGVDMQARPYRDSLYYQAWDQVVTFIGEELPAYINANYRTKAESVVFGWEQSASMVAELLFREDPPFDGYILSNGGYVNAQMIADYKQASQPKHYAYLANSQQDIYTIDETKTMVNTLEAHELGSLQWKSEMHNSEVHETLAYQSMYHGLRFFYHNYPSIVFADPAEFHERGGLPYLERYFRTRGKRFDLDPEIDASTKNALIWLAWKRDDFETFKLAMDSFSEVLETRRYASAYWQNRLGQFYLKHKHYAPAITFFERGINQFPNDRYMATMHAGLGQAYQATDKRKLAKTNFKKAVRFAREQTDPSLDKYQELLEELE